MAENKENGGLVIEMLDEAGVIGNRDIVDFAIVEEPETDTDDNEVIIKVVYDDGDNEIEELYKCKLAFVERVEG